MYLIRENKIFEIKKGENKLRTVYTADIHRIINAACYDGDGKFWIGSASGLSSYNIHTQEFKTIPTNFFNTILSLTLDKQGRLWIGAQNMLFSYIIAENALLYGENPTVSLPTNFISYLRCLTRQTTYTWEALPDW